MENINIISESNLEKFCNLKNFIPDRENIKKIGDSGLFFTEYINKKTKKYGQDLVLPEKSHETGMDKSCKNVICLLIRLNGISGKIYGKYSGMIRKYYLHRMVTA